MFDKNCFAEVEHLIRSWFVTFQVDSDFHRNAEEGVESDESDLRIGSNSKPTPQKQRMYSGIETEKVFINFSDFKIIIIICLGCNWIVSFWKSVLSSWGVL